MVSDSEPRYRLVDSNGNVVGSLYAQGDGTLALQEGTSGGDNEVTVATDGTFNAPAVSTGQLAFDGIDTNTATLSEANETEGDNQIQTNSKYTFGVGTSATTIMSQTGTGTYIGGEFTVLVREGTSKYRIDEVKLLTDGSASRRDSLTRNNPADTNYTVSNGNDLQLSLSAGTANVVAVGRYFDINAP